MVESDNARKDQLRRRAEARLGSASGEGRFNNLPEEEEDALALIRELRIHEFELKIQNEELETAQHELTKANERFIDLYDYAPVGYLTCSRDGAIEEVNITAARLLGRPRAAVTGGRLYRFVDAADAPTYFSHRRTLLESGQEDVCEVRLRRADGSCFEAMLQSTPVSDMSGKVTSFRTIITDISSRKAAERAWRQADTIIRESNEGVVVLDTERRITRINPAFTRLTHFAWSEIGGQDFEHILNGPPEALEIFWQTLLKEGRWSGELSIGCSDRDPFPASLSFVALTDEYHTVTAYAGLITDVTARKIAEEDLRQRAYYDTLTGVPNRALLTERLKDAAREAQRHGNLMSLMFVDLDRFKETNDRLGHAAGDELLKAVAGRLTQCVRNHDTVARVGGDEFAIVLTDVDSIASVATVADKVIAELKPPIWLSGQPVHCHASIGIAVYPSDAQDTDTLAQYADLAMYKSKSSDDISYSFFKESMTKKAQQHLRTQRELTRGLQRNEFRMYYQPIVHAASGELAGAESLLRWEHPERGLLLPQPFLTVAEETGQIMALGGWVIKQVGQDWKNWFQESSGAEAPFLCINVSPRQLQHPEAFRQTLEQLRACTLPAHRISLEITEGIAMDSTGAGHGYLSALKQLGVSLSMDDFGTGYSSLSYLRNLPFDVIKIDRSFVRDLETSPEAVHLVSAIVQMAHGLHMKVVAEGIETEGQLKYLQLFQCDYIQGNFISPPVPGEKMREFVERGVTC